jgi:hypothetical protein
MEKRIYMKPLLKSFLHNFQILLHKNGRISSSFASRGIITFLYNIRDDFDRK